VGGGGRGRESARDRKAACGMSKCARPTVTPTLFYSVPPYSVRSDELPCACGCKCRFVSCVTHTSVCVGGVEGGVGGSQPLAPGGSHSKHAASVPVSSVSLVASVAGGGVKARKGLSSTLTSPVTSFQNRDN